ncbi:MAG: SpaA isopeptide-forming pilin-related protein [Candidatus Pseudoruminococcus sp.]|nr:LPXTG cell wall anchor domain-containing protein [Ruminococcus sp.]MDY2783730.1 SpaA isopeptide-forming pilin-related protein [Candidatus Pseudoruminococcus sp.]
MEDELPFEVKLDTLDISVVDKYGHKFTPSEPLKMNIKKLNGSYDSEKYDLFVAHLMDDTLAIDKAIDSDTLQFAELSEESLPLFKDELNAVPSSAEKSDDSIAYTEHKAESNQDGSITIPVESFSIYQVASVNVTTGTYIRANSTIEMNVGESRVFYENTNEAHATWTVTDPTDAVLWNLHDPGKQIENEKWMQKYVWIKITAQHPADKITVTAKYGNSNKSEKFYISIPEPNFYIQNSIPKDGNISVHSDIQNVVSYKWSKESGKIVDEALYPNDTSRINVTIDKEYKLYKIFDATYGSDNSASYYINSSSEWYSLVTEADSPFTLDELAGSPNKYLVSKNGTDAVVTNWLKSNNVQKKIKNFTPVDTKTPTNTDKSVKFSNLDYGYYYITSTLGSAVTVTNAKADVVVIDKNQKSGWGTEGGKFIKTNKGTWGTENTANIGDKLDYKVLVDSAVNYQDDEKITEYIIKDTFGEAISMDLSTVKVNISGNDIKAGYNAITNKPVDSKDTTTTQANCKWYISKDSTTNNNEFSVHIKWQNVEGEFNYTAPTDIELTYSGTLMANADIGVEDVEKNTNTAELQWITDKGEYNDEEKTVVTYTFGLGILKYVANTEERTPLAGAKFQLKDSNGNVITPADGEILIIGLKDGGYQFVETAAPAGYNQLKDPVNVTVRKDTSDATIDDINCVITPIANSKGTLLPETGGVGTIIFISLGALIAVGAGLFLVTNKRMSKEDI